MDRVCGNCIYCRELFGKLFCEIDCLDAGKEKPCRYKKGKFKEARDSGRKEKK